MIPVRCYTCGKVIGNKWVRYERMIAEPAPVDREAIFETLAVTRWCCKRMLMCHVSFVSDTMVYEANRANIEGVPHPLER
jgi:DNA-directed RNA polymerase subunit N